MFNQNDIIKALEDRGYTATVQKVIKNGDVELDALTIRSQSNITPSIYLQGIYERCDSLDEAVNTIIEIYESNVNPPFDIDVNRITDKQFILDTVRIGIQKTSNENLVKRPTDFPDIEQYLYFGETASSSRSEGWSIRIQPELLANVGVDEDELWKVAEERTFSNIKLRTMYEVMSEMIGIPSDERYLDALSDAHMYILSNENGVKGAAGLLNREFVFNKFSRELGYDKICCIPSSIHEIIIIPVTEMTSIEDLDEMVKEVNATQVRPEEQLIDHALLIDFTGEL